MSAVRHGVRTYPRGRVGVSGVNRACTSPVVRGRSPVLDQWRARIPAVWCPRRAAGGLLLALLLGTVVARAGIADHVVRSHEEGIDLILYPTPIRDVVTVVGSLPAGDALAPAGQSAVPTLTGMMLDRGAREGSAAGALLDKYAIASRLENVGAAVSFEVGNQTLDIRARCLAKDLPLVIELLAAQLRYPAFNRAEFERVRQQFIGAVRSSIDNSSYRARDTLNRALFAADDPNYPQPIDALLASARTAGVEDVQRFHREVYGPRGMILVLVGAVDTVAARKAVATAFRGWQGGREPLPGSRAGVTPPARQVVELASKPSVTVLLGQATGLRYRDPDSLALRVATSVLGHGFTGRLMSTVRDREGLTYGVGASINEDSYSGGAFVVSASFAPQLLDQGIDSTRRELRKWWAEGITEAELEQRKQSLVGTFQVGLSSTGGVAGALLSTAQRGLDLGWLDRYPELIRELQLPAVNAVIRRYLDPDRMTLVEVGTLPAAKEGTVPAAAPR